MILEDLFKIIPIILINKILIFQKNLQNTLENNNRLKKVAVKVAFP